MIKLIIPGIFAVPEPFYDDSSLANKYLSYYIIEVVLQQLHLNHLLRVTRGNDEFELRLELALFERNAELALLFEGFEHVAPFRADHRFDRGEFRPTRDQVVVLHNVREELVRRESLLLSPLLRKLFYVGLYALA